MLQKRQRNKDVAVGVFHAKIAWLLVFWDCVDVCDHTVNGRTHGFMGWQLKYDVCKSVNCRVNGSSWVLMT